MRVVLLNQTFPPDVVSSAQHAGDLARALTAAGHDVTVVTSRRAYDTPSLAFPAAEHWQGVKVLRVRGSGLGKKAKWRRAADFGTLLCSCFVRVLMLPRIDVIVTMTSPPLISFVAAVAARLRGGRLVLWVLDLNPDEAIAAGWLRGGAAAARVLRWCLAYSLGRADHVVVLDRFMKERVEAKLTPPTRRPDPAPSPGKVIVLPPWSHDSAVRYDLEAREAFRRAHGLDGKFVVMYSGNHSPCHPLQTLLEAARRLARHAGIVFCFIGGGSEFEQVGQFAARHGLGNVRWLPYQPLDTLSASLSAADLHVVVMGDRFVGIVHPCKVYNILRLGIPFVYIGPPRSHVTDLASAAAANGADGWMASAPHGDVGAVVSHILQRAGAGRSRYETEVQLSEHFSQRLLATRLVELIEGSSRASA